MDTTPDASRPVRRTYGRARPVDASGGLDEPLPSLVYSSTETVRTVSTMSTMSTVSTSTTAVSPARNLLNTFTKRSADWLGATRSGHSSDPAGPSSSVLASSPPPALGSDDHDTASSSDGKDGHGKRDDTNAEPEDKDDDDDFSIEDVQAYMAKMRKEAQKASGSRPDAIATPNAAADATRVPTTSHSLFPSSSLTDIPTTSPSKRPEPAVPTRSEDGNKNPKRVVDEDNSDNRDDASPPPPPSSQTKLSTHEHDEMAITRQSPEPSSTPVFPIRATAPRWNKRVIDSDSESDTEEGVDAASDASLTPKAKPAAPRLSFEAEGSAEDEQQREKTPRKEADLSGLFSDEENDIMDTLPTAKRKLPKQLNKADQIAMRQDIARAEREKPIMVSRPEPKRRPVSQWMARAHEVAVTLPSQTSTKSQPSKSPQLTSDDIQQFPSSGHHKGRQATGPLSSPTPGVDKIIPISSGPSHDDDENEAQRDRDRAEEKRKQLLEFKKLALAKKSKGKEKATPAPAVQEEVDLDDEDLSVIPAKGKLTFTPSHRKVPEARGAELRGGDARGVLSRTTVVPAPTRTRQNVMKWSGKRAKQDVTETHIDFAGRQFGHAELKRNNGGSRPAGMKKGRDEVISQAQVEYQMLARHKEQVRKLAKSKEERFGAGRELPEKHTLDISELVRSSNEAGDLVAESDVDDSDFAPSGGEDEDAEAEGSDDDERASAVQGTLPDELDEMDEDENAADDEDGDKENQPVPRVIADDEDDEDENPFKVSHRPSARRRLVASDDEDEPEVRDMSLREATKTQPAAAAASAGAGAGGFGADFGQAFGGESQAAGGLDLAGFGSAGGGFSQLFGATQAAGGDPEGGDAFAALRNAPELDPFPTHDLLPGVDISETQKRRDNALIAAEIENANANVPTPKAGAHKKQYLNSQGFFTQTRPAGRELTQTGSVEDLTPIGEMDGDEDGSPVGGAGLVKSSSTLLNSTTDAPSPTSEEETFSRLRRRVSPPPASPDTERDTPPRNPSPSPIKKPKSRNAFDVLQRGATREAEKAQLRKDRPAFLDEQAEESDEDNGWGMGIGAGQDDEDDEDMDNGYVPELLDDKEVDEEEKLRQAELVAAKFREVEQADDARREAEAKKVVQGEHRIKRKGNEFLSDDEDEDGQPRRKFTKQQRRQRRLEKEDGLFKLDDEANVFVQAYEEDLISDNEIDEEPASPSADMSPVRQLTAHERQEMLRLRARMNDSESLEGSLFGEDEEESQYSISNKARNVLAPPPQPEEQDEPSWSRGVRVTRSIESYSKIISEESINPRRAGAGAAGVSVVMSRTEVVARGSSSRNGSLHSGAGGAAANGKASRSVTRQGSSILLDREKRFG